MKKLFYENVLPQCGKKIDWINSIGKVVHFIYNEIEGDLTIVDYVKQHSMVVISYNKTLYNIYSLSLKRANFKNLFLTDIKAGAQEGYKICTFCKRELPLSAFNNKSESPDGKRSQCRECQNKKNREYDTNHKEKKKQYQDSHQEEIRQRRAIYNQTHQEDLKEYYKQYNEKNKEKRKEQAKKYREENLEQIKEKSKHYREENKERINAKIRQWREYNPEKMKSASSNYYQNHKEESRCYHREYDKKKKETDPFYVFKKRVRGNLRSSLKHKNISKKSKTIQLIGCSFEEVWEHLLKTWENNYGTKWNGEPYHIDHIIPLATAKTEKEVLDLCKINNLQLLTPEDNMSKKDKLDWSLNSQKKSAKKEEI